MMSGATNVKRFASRLVAAAQLSIWLAGICNAATPTPNEVETMRSVVEEQGLAGFMTATVTNSWEAPTMFSAWHVANVATLAQRPDLEEARELGSALLTAIDAWAPLIRSDTPDDTLTKATLLIDLAYWLGSTDGYTNFVLARRARDVAITGLARRVANLGAPLASTQAQLARCRAPFDQTTVRARVLNLEAGTALFPTGAGITDQTLVDIWSRRQLKRVFPQLEAVPTPIGGTEDPDVSAIRRMIESVGITPGSLDAADVFFTDDELGEEPTTRRLWNKKWHQVLLSDTAPQNLGSVETLTQFRQTVGTFPLQPTERLEQLSTPGEEAFAEAWEPHIGSATFNAGRGAWDVYDRISRGHLLDYDSATSMAAAARVAAQWTPTAPPSTNTPVGTTPPATP